MKIQLYVISTILKLLDKWEKDYQRWVEETRQKVEVAVDQLERGEGIDGEIVVERLRSKLRQETRSARGETNLSPLHGTVVRYDDPTEPVDEGRLGRFVIIVSRQARILLDDYYSVIKTVATHYCRLLTKEVVTNFLALKDVADEREKD